MRIIKNFKCFQYFNFETDFLENENLFQKAFLDESIKIENTSFPYKLPYQKSMLRQTKWWLQNGPIKKNEVLPITSLYFWKFCFSLRTSYKESICYTNNRNANICTFCKRWSFIWRSFFPVSILKSFETISDLFLI